jgi:hypothetical protein
MSGSGLEAELMMLLLVVELGLFIAKAFVI